MLPYTAMLDLNSFLKESLIREIQIIKTGFAICSTSAPAKDTLYSCMGEIKAYLSTRGECKVEKLTRHKAYLLSGIPQSYLGFNGSSLVPIKSLPLPRITEKEVTRAIIRVSTTTPGKDGISTAIVCLAWP